MGMMYIIYTIRVVRLDFRCTRRGCQVEWEGEGEGRGGGSGNRVDRKNDKSRGKITVTRSYNILLAASHE